MQNQKRVSTPTFYIKRDANMKTAIRVGVAALGLVIAGSAMAQFKNAEESIKYRRAAFTVMGQHFGQIGAMVNGRVPFDAQKAKSDAAVVMTLSQLPWVAFGADTATGDTKAKAEIWKEQDKFKAAADKTMSEVAKLDAAAKTGNVDQIKVAFGAVGQSCKACHDAYRAK
jgi:cytochrome c556